ncbi:Two-component response regulator-like APRR7 [Forsythia ovata]|uniref:Two-component response regulator-like APRR7 n=1 Tax=Forsythia ovata TaxID=205694 RepID=A0ABD1R1T3_9LAMI
MEANGHQTNGLVELNHHHMQNCPYGITGDRKGVFEEEELRNNEVSKQHTKSVQAQAIKQTQQQEPRGAQWPLVLWERFLPLGSLKVLLVENDESTQQVVKALLRNCSYEVTAVANGLQAWKILEDTTNHIDLVLTELSMPYLSGIGLLTKIKNHKTCKNIPVIMMSANDSMGIVFKCLSKGAADFLLKPIRKNEVKNIWQHVWRKCQSSSCSESESGIRTQKSTKSKCSDVLDNYNDSGDEGDNESVGLNARGGNDDISSTQSSWSKTSVEGGSPQPLSPWNELANAPDSTSSQNIHSRLNVLRVPTASTIKHLKQDDALDNTKMGKDLEIGLLNNPNLELQGQGEEVFASTLDTENDKFHVLDSMEDSNNSKMEKVDLRNGSSSPIDAITNIPIHLMVSVSHNVSGNLSKITNDKHTAYDPKEMSCLEISLKRLRETSDTGIDTLQQNVLRRSDVSAFSRYNANATSANEGRCFPVNNSSEASKTGVRPYQGSNGSSPNNDLGSTTNNAFAKKEGNNDKTMPDHPSSASQTMQQGNTFRQPIILDKPDTSNTTLAQGKALDWQNKVQNHHHHHHHHHYQHHHPHNLQEQQPLNHDDLSLGNLTAVAAKGGASDKLGQEMEGNANNYGSASGSNGQNGSSGHHESDNKAIAKCGAGEGSGCGSRSEVDQNRLSQREASLNKFRQKRKERCFEKKVRYHSRKRLAEQRPRVKGQFVRQITDENRNQAENRTGIADLGT